MTQQIITRAEAKAQGLKRYFTGVACKNGHVSDRITNNGTCLVCHNERGSITYIKNREQRIQQMREYRAENWPKVRAIQYAWQAKNPGDGAKRAASRRKLARLGSILQDDEFNDLVFCEAYALAGHREQCTGIRWHVDHMIPLKSKLCCGLHVWMNIQVIPARLNNIKLNRMMFTEPMEWLRHL